MSVQLINDQHRNILLSICHTPLTFYSCSNREMDGPDFLKNHNMFQFASGMTGSLQCRLTLHHIRYCWGEKIQAKHVSGEVTKGTSKPGYLNLQENLESTKVGKCGEVAAAEFGIPLCSHLRFGWASCQSHLLIRNTSQRSSHQLDHQLDFPSAVFFFFCDLEGARGFIRGMSSYKLYFFPFKRFSQADDAYVAQYVGKVLCREKGFL